MIRYEGWQRKFTEARGLRFSHLEWGRPGALPLVFLHGITRHGHSWDPLSDAFKNDCHVLALDQRGHGETQWPDPPSYDTADYVDDLAALIEAWGLDRFVLVGLSMGAHNGLAFAARYPDRVRSLVPVDIPPAMRRSQGAAPQSPPQAPPTVFDTFEAMLASARQGQPRAPDDLLHHWIEANARQTEDGRWTFKHSPDATRNWRPADLWEEIRTIRCPTLVVRGGESNVLSPEVAEQEVAAIPRARLVTIAGSGHNVPLDKAPELVAAIRELLVSQSS